MVAFLFELLSQNLDTQAETLLYLTARVGPKSLAEAFFGSRSRVILSDF